MNDTSWKTKAISIWHNQTADSGGSLAMHHVLILTSRGHSENGRGFLAFEQLIPLELNPQICCCALVKLSKIRANK